MELLALVAVAFVAFFLIGVPWLAISGRNEAKAARAAIEPLVGQIARLQQQIDALRVGPGPFVAREPAVADTNLESAHLDRVDLASETPEIRPPAWGPPPLPPPLPARAAQAEPAPSRDFEELVGTRWAIWVGGVALALGTLFLVVVSIEAGIIGPRLRLILAAAFSAGFVYAGEMLRRGAVLPRRFAVRLPAEHAPLALTAAGTIGLFGTVYAAHAVYGFIPQSLAFVLLGLIGIAAMAASALHGQALAGLGLLGSYATPLLIGGETESRWPLVLYLLVVTAAGLALDRRLKSIWLGWGVIGGVAVWSALLIFAQKTIPIAELVFMTASLALFAASFVWLRSAVRPQTPFGDPEPLVALSGLAAAIGLSFVAQAGAPTAHAVFAIAAVSIVAATACRDGRAALAIIAAGLLPLGMLLTWPAILPSSNAAGRVIDGAMLIIEAPPQASGVMAVFAVIMAAILTLAPLALFLRHFPIAARHRTAGLFALAITGGVGAPLIAFGWSIRLEGLTQNATAAIVMALLCIGLAFAADRLLRQGGEGRALREAEIGAGGYASGAALALGLGIAFALPGLWMAVGFGVAALGVAALNDRRPLPMLRRVAAAFATTAALRAILSPVLQPEGAWPILNTYLVAYGLPVLLLGGASVLLARQRSDRNLTVLRATTGVMAAVFLAYEIRHAFHGRDLVDEFRIGLGEAGLYVLASVGACLGLYLVRARLQAEPSKLRPVLAGINILSLALLVLFVLLLANPWLGNPWFHSPISGPFFVDSTFVGFLLPAVALGALAYFGRTLPDWFVAPLTTVNRAFAIGLGYLFVLAQTRRAFVGLERFRVAYTGEAEQWAYSLVTLAFGVALLAIGFKLDSKPTRLASSIFVILAVLKVFIIDMAELGGILRAFSFIGLGGVLIGIGLAYQRLLFDKKGASPPPLPPPLPSPP